VLVALAVMMLLLTIILVPVNLALDIFHIGKARNEVQQANRLVMNQMIADLKQAVFVYPNEAMPGITDKPPYSNNSNYPYYDTNAAAGVSNTARIDMLLPAQNTNGAILTPLQATNYIVTYYARRLKYNAGTADYDQYSNPIVLWRAQYAYKTDGGVATAVKTDSTRYTPSADTWLTQNQWDEPNLESLSSYSSTTQSSSHVLITPRDMALVAPNASAGTSYQPDTTFICDDTDNDGKIDRVTISIHEAKYDSIGASKKSQQLRSTQVVDLPNVK
jgi:hypothetical protein